MSLNDTPSANRIHIGFFGDGNTVVGEGNVLVQCALHAVAHFARGEHAAAAVDNRGKATQVLREARAGARFKGELRAGVAREPAGQLYGADVVALPMMRAAFGDEDAVAVLQRFQPCRAAHGSLQKALAARHENRKRRERNLRRHDSGNQPEDLTVGDNKVRRSSK